jgi:hypothetical protein
MSLRAHTTSYEVLLVPTLTECILPQLLASGRP